MRTNRIGNPLKPSSIGKTISGGASEKQIEQALCFSLLALYLDNTGGASEKQIEQALCFSLLALYLDNTGGASEKQIEQALCFSLGLHYICNRKKLLK